MKKAITLWIPAEGDDLFGRFVENFPGPVFPGP